MSCILCFLFLLLLFLYLFLFLFICMVIFFSFYSYLTDHCPLVSFVVGRWLTHPFGSLPTGEVGAFGCETTYDTFSLRVMVIKVSNRGLSPVNNVIDHYQLPTVRVVHTTASPMCINGINARGYG